MGRSSLSASWGRTPLSLTQRWGRRGDEHQLGRDEGEKLSFPSRPPHSLCLPLQNKGEREIERERETERERERDRGRERGTEREPMSNQTPVFKHIPRVLYALLARHTFGSLSLHSLQAGHTRCVHTHTHT